MTSTIARNSAHLTTLVHAELARLGPRCTLNHIDVSLVDDFSWLFTETEFDGDVSQWDMSRAVNLTGMFRESYFSGDISRWNVSTVAQMGMMFAYCPFNGDISQWNTSSLVQAYDLFDHSGFGGDVSAWDVAKVVSTNGMFSNSEFSGDVSAWDVRNVRDMSRMFEQLRKPFDLSQWKPSRLIKAEATLSRESLDAMEQPCFYHWYAALSQGYPLRSAWQQHLGLLASIAQSFHPEHSGQALFFQEQWVKQYSSESTKMDCVELPFLDT